MLHIGGAKCGSTSIQTFLTNNPLLESRESVPYRYAVINPDFSVTFPEPNQNLGSVICPHLSSVPIPVSHERWSRFNDAISEILRACDNKYVPILSSEAWAEWFIYFKLANTLKLFPDTIFESILFVRPQIDWFNSAWWQWGVWSDLKITDWILNYSTNTCDWYSIAKGWSELAINSKVYVYETSNRRHYTGNVLHTLMDHIDVSFEDLSLDRYSANVTPPLSLINFFQRHRNLRSDMHDVSIENLLKERVHFSGKRPGNVLSLDHKRYILKRYTNGNRELAGYFNEFNREFFLNSTKWFPQALIEEDVITTNDQCEVDLLICDLINAITR